MISIEKCYKLLDSGFSLVTLSDDKKANFSWGDNQQKTLSKQEFERRYSYSGGIFIKDKNGKRTIEMKPTAQVGFICGFNNLEVIDVDLKVFPTLPEQEAFWSELYNYLRDNIDDFDLKFVIYKTKNQGYHILYRCDKIQGNSKIAVLKGQKEAVIESRGKGGYVVIYDNKISKKDYLNISTISERDREILWTICKTYHYQDEAQQIQPESKTVKEYTGQDITPWQDYNQRHSIFDVIGDEFKIVRKLSKHYIILRHGATSSQSGYVYTDSGCMYLFSTGTHYPNEKLISPFIAFAYRYHNGDFSAAAREIYAEGYGSRRLKPLPPERIKTVINTDDLIFPIDIFPPPIQTYIIECNKTLDSSIDYMGCSMLWATSLIVGNSINIQVKPKWREVCNIWIAVVGKAGIGKSPSIDNIIYPLRKINSREIKTYIKNYDKWQAYEKMDKDEKKQVEDVSKPNKSQFIVDDITLEALIDLHGQSKNGVGVFKDELNGWFKDMNKYREGSDLEFWLSTWSGKSVTVNRVSRSGSFVEYPLIPVLGGIQPSVLNSIYTEENKDNGFVDRMLLTFPSLEVEYYNDEELPYETIEWYNNAITAFYEHMKKSFLVIDDDGEIVPYTAHWSAEAKVQWKRIFNEITTMQRSDEENEYMKSMLPKQKSYIPRFALLLHCLDCYLKSRPEAEMLSVSDDAILKAERLSKYFIAMAKKIKENTIEVTEMKTAMQNGKNKSKKEVFLEMYRANPEINRTEAGELLGISRRQIQRYIDEFNQIGVT